MFQLFFLFVGTQFEFKGGKALIKSFNKAYKKNPNINCLILLNHGIFTFADDAKTSYNLMIKYVSDAEKAINSKNLTSNGITKLKEKGN